MNNQLTSEVAGYSSKNSSVVTYIIHQKLDHFVNHMPIFQKDTKNQEDDKNIAPNVEIQGHVNATLTTSDIKEFFKTMMQKFKPAGLKSNSNL